MLDRKRKIYFIVLLIVVVGFGLRLYALTSESLWYDELLQLDIAQGNPPGQGGLASIWPRLPGHTAAPLDYVISYFWIKLGQINGSVRVLPESEAWVRIPAVVFGTLALPLAYQLGRSLLGNNEGLLLMGLLAFSPLHVRYSQEARPYALVVLGVILAGYAFWRFRATGCWRYVGLLQVGLLIFALSHIFSVTIWGVLLVFAIIDLIFSQNRQRATHALTCLLATGAITLAVLLAFGWADPLYYSAKNFGEALIEPEAFTVKPSQKPNRGTGPHVDWLFVRYDVMERLGVGDRSPWLIDGLLGLSVIALLSQKRYKLTLFLLLWLVLPVALIVSFLVYRGTFYAQRYIIQVLPAYLILLAAGISALPGWFKRIKMRRLSLCLFVVLSAFVFWYLGGALDRLYQNRQKENWRIVAEFITRNVQPGDVVIAMKAEHAVNWYYPPAWAAPNYYDDLAHIQVASAKARRTWLIFSAFSTRVDPKVRAWIKQNQPDALHFLLDPAIVVYYFGHNTDSRQLLKEAGDFPLRPDYHLYARLAEENRSKPAIARQYYQWAIIGAPNDKIRAFYRQALEALPIN